METAELTVHNIFLPDYRGRLLEGVTYNSSNDTLIWVDIIRAEVHRVFLSESARQHNVIKFKEEGESIGNIGLTSDDNVIIVCAKKGIAKGNFLDGSIKYFRKYNHNDAEFRRLRSNDGLIDPWGHLWIGIMTDFDITEQEGGVSKEGKLYRVNCHELNIETMLDECFIPNGICFSRDRKKVYFTDSLSHTVWAFDYSFIHNRLSNKRSVLNVREIMQSEKKVPDGMMICQDDLLYSAIYEGGCVLKYDTNGNILEMVSLPAAKVTSVTIGGKNFDQLFITTAHENATDHAAIIDSSDKSGDLGGFLYRLPLGKGVKDVRSNTWGGK